MCAPWYVIILLLLSSSTLLLGCSQPLPITPALPAATPLQPSIPSSSASPQPDPTTLSEDAPAASQPSPTSLTPTAQGIPLPAIELGTRPLALQTPRLVGQDVQQVQQRLLDLGYRQVRESDGIFGPLTEAAVRTFQMVNQLTVDGIVGPETLGRLRDPDATPGWVVTPIAAPLCGEYLLLGASYAGAWFDNQTTGSLLRGGEDYRLFAGGRLLGNAVGMRPEQRLPANPPLGVAFFVSFATVPSDDGEIVLGGEWDAQPRSIRVISDTTGLSRYEAAMQMFLQQNGVAEPTFVQQATGIPETDGLAVWLTDLEGDGTEDAIIEARITQSADPSIASYSFILIQRDTTLIPVAVNIHRRSAEPQFDWVIYRIRSLVDINGDKTMEIIVDEGYFESGAVSIYEMVGTNWTRRLSVWCGV